LPLRANVQAKLYEIINRIFGNFEHVKLQDENKTEKFELNKFHASKNDPFY
jgi:hypothetical protein